MDLSRDQDTNSLEFFRNISSCRYDIDHNAGVEVEMAYVTMMLIINDLTANIR